MSAEHLEPEERAALAAEFALGLLEGDELAQARALVRTDAAFRSDVGRWTARFATLLDTAQPVAPDPSLWTGIAARLGPSDAANDNNAALRRSLARWRLATAGLGAAAAALALVLIASPEPAPLRPPAPVQASTAMVAMIAGEAGASPVRLVANWDPSRRQLIVTPAMTPEVADDRSMELWIVPADGPPHSIGVMPTEGPMKGEIAGPMETMLSNGATLAISIERKGGSPTGSPQGPVVGTGKLVTA